MTIPSQYAGARSFLPCLAGTERVGKKNQYYIESRPLRAKCPRLLFSVSATNRSLREEKWVGWGLRCNLPNKETPLHLPPPKRVRERYFVTFSCKDASVKDVWKREPAKIVKPFFQAPFRRKCQGEEEGKKKSQRRFLIPSSPPSFLSSPAPIAQAL